MPVEVTYPVVREIIEAPRLIGKHTVPFYATWQIIRDGGEHLTL